MLGWTSDQQIKARVTVAIGLRSPALPADIEFSSQFGSFDILVYTAKLSLSSTSTSKPFHHLFINHHRRPFARHPPICFLNDHAQYDNEYVKW
jgi:hypothetical protein